jgi:hypothetical protein
VPRHNAWLIARHVARLIKRLVIDYIALSRIVIDYFAYAARPGSSARRAARQEALRRLLRLRRASGCLGTSLSSSCRLIVDYFASRRLVDGYFAYAARPGASAHRVARHHGSLRGSSSTTLPRAGSSSTTSP